MKLKIKKTATAIYYLHVRCTVGIKNLVFYSKKYYPCDIVTISIQEGNV